MLSVGRHLPPGEGYDAFLRPHDLGTTEAIPTDMGIRISRIDPIAPPPSFALASSALGSLASQLGPVLPPRHASDYGERM